MLIFTWGNIYRAQSYAKLVLFFSYLLQQRHWKIQGYNARKVNWSPLYSAYILKFVSKNQCNSVRLVSKEVKSITFDNFDNSHNSFLWLEYLLILHVKDGSHARLRQPYCVYITAQRQYPPVQKMHKPMNNFPCIITLGKYNFFVLAFNRINVEFVQIIYPTAD